MGLNDPINMAEWRNVPCKRGQIATRLDSEEGRAAFFIPRTSEDIPDSSSEGIVAEEVHAIPIDLPHCAILKSEEGETPVIVIQAESTFHNGRENQLAGYRSLDGGVGVCMFYELTLLEGPDERFFGVAQNPED